MDGAEFDTRLMNMLHYSRQASHVLFTTTERGYVEQHITTDMAMPDLGDQVLIEDITPEPIED